MIIWSLGKILSTKKKVLCFSGYVYRGFEHTDLKLVSALKKSGFEVTYAAKSNQMFENYIPIKLRKRNIITKIFGNEKDNQCGLPGFNKIFETDQSFIEKDTIWIKRWSDLKKLIKINDIIILGSFRNNNVLIEYARFRNKVVLVHKNPANLDYEGRTLPNIYCTKDENEKNEIIKKINKKKIKKVLKDDLLKTTSSLQYAHDDNKILDKSFFYEKYKLDSTKKTFIFLSSAPQIQNLYYQKTYQKICETISKKHNILIKGHPSDYAKRKLRKEYNNKSSWEYLAPNIKVCEPEDFYSAISHSTATISIFSTVFFEVNKLGKPVIFVDKFDNFSFNILNKEEEVSDDYYDHKIKKQLYEFKDSFLKVMEKKLSNRYFHNEFIKSSQELTCKSYYFYGCDIKSRDLESFLDNFDTNNSNNFPKIELEEIKSITDNIIKVLREYLILYEKKNNFTLRVKNFIYFFKNKLNI